MTDIEKEQEFEEYRMELVLLDDIITTSTPPPSQDITNPDIEEPEFPGEQNGEA